eukprot:TRINITY_DN52760_c0_g1_i1.p1 TRINITY_DN52760_c0_g1~~TRINITY_DN52760_c0_g1_i1.p1  ORF type:complete len:112 (-),score=11.80 TRINITY_DN52760_c0_g1_i1:13-348(-)
MIRRPPRSTLSSSSAASDVYKRQTMYKCVRRVCSKFTRDKTVVISVVPPGQTQKEEQRRDWPIKLMSCSSSTTTPSWSPLPPPVVVVSSDRSLLAVPSTVLSSAKIVGMVP